MPLRRSFLLHFVWCCAIIAALVLSDELYPWASHWGLRSTLRVRQMGRDPGTGSVMIAVPQGVDIVQHLAEMKSVALKGPFSSG